MHEFMRVLLAHDTTRARPQWPRPSPQHRTTVAATQRTRTHSAQRDISGTRLCFLLLQHCTAQRRLQSRKNITPALPAHSEGQHHCRASRLPTEACCYVCFVACRRHSHESDKPVTSHWPLLTRLHPPTHLTHLLLHCNNITHCNQHNIPPTPVTHIHAGCYNLTTHLTPDSLHIPSPHPYSLPSPHPPPLIASICCISP